MKREVAAWVIAGLFAILTVTGFGVVQAYWRLQSYLETLIAARFDDPHVRETFQDVAAGEARVLLRERLEPQVQEAKALVAQLEPKVAEAQVLVAEVKATTEAALEPLRRAQRVTILQGKASDSSRAAYDELRSLAEEDDDETTRTLAAGALRTIESAFAFTDWMGDPELTVKGEKTKVSDLDTELLLQFLGAQGEELGAASMRGRAALILARRKEQRAVPILIRLITPGLEEESHLISLKAEISALKQLVPQLPEVGSHFHWKPIVDWWDTNRMNSVGAPMDSPP